MDQHGKSGNPTTLGGNSGTLPLPYASGRFGTTETFMAQANFAYTLKPSLVNVFAVSWLRFITPDIDPTTGQGWAGKIGLTGLPGAAADYFPQVSFGGPNAPSIWHNITNAGTFIEVAETYTAQDNLQWAHGKHNVTIGGSIAREEQNETQPRFRGSASVSLKPATSSQAALTPPPVILMPASFWERWMEGAFTMRARWQ